MPRPGVVTFPRAIRTLCQVRYGAIAAAVFLLPAALLPSLTTALLWPIQSRFQRADLQAGPEIAGFIALGGPPDRINEAVALGLRHLEAKVVMTGYDTPPATYVLKKGIDGSRLRVETTAINTYENAVHTARLLGAEKTGRWIIVTSASHMPRAMGCFRKAGFSNVEAWPVPDLAQDWADRLHIAVHEWVGLLVYWLDGRTDALFPSPPMPTAIATAAITVDPEPAGGAATP